MDLNKLTKKQSGVVFLIVYLFTMFLGYIVVVFSPYFTSNGIIALLIADIIMTIVVFIIGSVIKNASLYDPYWSVIPPYLIGIAIIKYLRSQFTLVGILLLIVISFWAIRLTYNWWKNWIGFSKQDWRYDFLKKKSPKLYPITNFFGIHMIPTMVVFLQLINAFEILSQTSINFVFVIGLIMSVIAPIIQFISDKQMFDFRTSILPKTKVINTGLWRFSRHPNYFGELLFWVGIYVMYLSFVKTLNINIVYPIAMILLFVFISIPMMENRLLNRPGYKKYKKSVSMIIPFFSKESK